ncbi:MAG: glycosyltransferase family 9 protein [Hyphomonadaceae bacterium]|nr:glycosyltransferase family 9 protein [Hyphomonadaceae bacterium]
MGDILFISSTRIGDAVLSSGALAHAQKLFPEAGVVVACGRLPAPLFRATPNLKSLHVVDRRSSGGHWLPLWKALRGERFDLAIDLRGSLITYGLRAKRRIRHAKSAQVRHKVEEISALMGAPCPPRLHIDAKAKADAATAGKGPLLALGPGANFIGKRWRPDRFAALARRLTGPLGALSGARIVILGSDEDAVIAREIVDSLDADGLETIDLTGKLDLLACAALLENATLFVGNDSGLMHIAAATGAATLGLFGPSDERVYGPWGVRTKALRGRAYEEIMAVGPLQLIDRTLMDDVGVDAVEHAAGELMRAGGLA